LSLLKK